MELADHVDVQAVKMDNEFDLDLDEGSNEQNINNNRSDKRINNLTEKVKGFSEKADSEAKARAEAEAKVIELEKERDFLNEFSTSASKYQGASEFKDAIKEKVLRGYSVEDATVATLAAEGKLSAPQAPRDNPAGGSATNSLQSDGPKPLNEMSREDKRAELVKAEAEGGDLSRILRQTN